MIKERGTPTSLLLYIHSKSTKGATMSLKLLQIDFPVAGPWGAEMAAAYSDLARNIAATPGLRWKIWTENAETGESGGIYLFEDEASLDAYLKMHTERLKSFGINNINAKKFDVNEALNQITRAKL
jgi:hypothetical protein